MLTRLRCWRILGETLAVGIASAAIFLAGLVLVSAIPPPGVSVPPSSTVSERRPVLEAVSDSGSDTAPRPGVPVVCHHYLRPNTTPRGFARILGALFLNLPLLGDMDVWTQTAAVFDAQMAYLKNEGYTTVDLADIAAWRQGRGELPPRPIVITFDDGDRSVLEVAYPILQKYGFKATLFVVTSQVGRKWDRVDCLGWEDLRVLQESGVFSIQSHSHDLHRKVKTSRGALPVFLGAKLGVCDMSGTGSWAEAVYRDLRTSKELIERRVGGEVIALAWPYGFGDAQLDSVAVSAGFSVLCTLAEGTNPYRASESDAERLARESREIRRFTITARTSLRAFEEMLNDRPLTPGSRGPGARRRPPT